MGRVTVVGGKVGMEAPSLYKPVFADNTWEQIIEACQTNNVPDTWEVGDQKAMTINGTDYLIDIIGKNHDDYADGSGKAPLTFQMHDCYATQYAINANSSDTNSGGWESCEMRNTTLPKVLKLMPNTVQTSIRTVTKKASAGDTSSSIKTSHDKLFLLSEIEVFGTLSLSFSGEGTQYAYYAAGNSKIKTINGSAVSWWERSPSKNNSEYWCRVYAYDSMASHETVYSDQGLSFAFCF